MHLIEIYPKIKRKVLKIINFSFFWIFKRITFNKIGNFIPVYQRFPSLKNYFKLYEKIKEQIDDTEDLFDIDFSFAGREKIIENNRIIDQRFKELKNLADFKFVERKDQIKKWAETTKKIELILLNLKEKKGNENSMDVNVKFFFI
jgi:hypothetical protein